MTAHSELVARPALRHLLFVIARCLSTGVLAGAAAAVYWSTMPSPLSGGNFASGIAVMAAVAFFGLRAKEPQPDGEKT